MDQISIRDIAATAGINYTTFFRHHPTKESLLGDIAAEEIQHIVGMSFPIFRDTDSRSGSLALCTYVNDNRALWTTLLTGGAAAAMRQEFVRLSKEIASSWESPLEWLPADLGTVMTASGTFELLAWWLGQAHPLPSERVAEIYHRMLVAPMAIEDKKPRKNDISESSDRRGIRSKK